jgi:hypothetical protein
MEKVTRKIGWHNNPTLIVSTDEILRTLRRNRELEEVECPKLNETISNTYREREKRI